MTKKKLLCDAAKLAEKSAKIIEEVGWVQGKRESYVGGPVCLIGAISKADVGCPLGGPITPAGQMLWEQLRKICGPSPIVWNDTIGTTRRMVLSRLRKARDMLARASREEPA